MIDDAQIAKDFADFLSIKNEIGKNLAQSRILQHKNFVLSKDPLYSPGMIFMQMADDFTSRLISELNRFLVGIIHADCWYQVAKRHDEGDKLSLLWEYADPHLEILTGRPYSIKQHLIFAAVHLLHQADRFKNPTWRDKLPPDREINSNFWKNFNANWPNFPQFQRQLALLDDKKYRRATLDFRNRLQHRFRSHFGYGLTPYFEREETTTGVTYSYNILPALDLDTLIPIFYEQHQFAAEAFVTFWRIVEAITAECYKKYGCETSK